jgi:hypothetical protein
MSRFEDEVFQAAHGKYCYPRNYVGEATLSWSMHNKKTRNRQKPLAG